MHYIDFSTWKRKEHFEFFSSFDEPFYGVTVDLDCTAVYRTAKANRYSFYLYYMHKILTAVNATEAMRYRITDDHRIVVYDTISVSPTIGREDGTFGYSRFNYDTDFNEFAAAAIKETERIKALDGLGYLCPDKDVIHFSALPWIKFTGISHARSFKFPDSMPKISVGKVSTAADGKMMMPISIHVHHGLADGYHLGLFVQKLEELFLTV
ncbi:chloramphenicol acetyltransferase [Mucilaginibacter limnophilus]|uniref:Chloramphenicol acetyltransferase n=1 Tax=Mucilaginibacter limnophilus TaxID=1932778 RepID=A0A3S2VM65_9SPHI|nr:chloramphenicol acetyltransferase [Mucilaginibacter limnophilus]RVU00570.1 chloramphenicol acetyltransferase [Mucilaginibacter limnophilus]